MTGRQWKPRAYRPGDEKQILNLFREGFHEERTIDHWTWEYRKNPVAKGMVFLADSNAEIVGHYAVIPTLFRVGEQDVLGSQSVDTVTLEGFRRKGVFTTLARLTYEKAKSKGVRFVYGYPNRFSYHGLVKKLGFQEVATVPKLAKTLSLKGLLLRISKRPRVLRKFSFLGKMPTRHSDRTKPSNTNKVHIAERTGPFGPEFDELWNRTKKDFRVATVRNADYLNWRYVERPMSKYEIFEAREKNRILGFIIGRMLGQDSWKEGYVVDFLCARTGIFEQLLDALMDRFKEEEVDIAYIWMLRTCNLYKNVLAKGFNEVKSDLLLTSKTLADMLDVSVGDPRNWFVTRGDCDGI